MILVFPSNADDNDSTVPAGLDALLMQMFGKLQEPEPQQESAVSTETDPIEIAVDSKVKEAEQMQIELLASDIHRIRVKEQRRKIKHSEALSIRNILGEFFDTYVVMAYDLEGNRVCIKRTPNPASQDSLQRLLERVTASGLVYTPDEEEFDEEDMLDNSD